MPCTVYMYVLISMHASIKPTPDAPPSSAVCFKHRSIHITNTQKRNESRQMRERNLRPPSLMTPPRTSPSIIFTTFPAFTSLNESSPPHTKMCQHVLSVRQAPASSFASAQSLRVLLAYTTTYSSIRPTLRSLPTRSEQSPHAHNTAPNAPPRISSIFQKAEKVSSHHPRETGRGLRPSSFGEGVNVAFRGAGMAEAGVLCERSPDAGLPSRGAADARVALPVKPIVEIFLHRTTWYGHAL